MNRRLFVAQGAGFLAVPAFALPVLANEGERKAGTSCCSEELPTTGIRYSRAIGEAAVHAADKVRLSARDPKGVSQRDLGAAEGTIKVFFAHLRETGWDGKMLDLYRQHKGGVASLEDRVAAIRKSAKSFGLEIGDAEIRQLYSTGCASIGPEALATAGESALADGLRGFEAALTSALNGQSNATSDGQTTHGPSVLAPDSCDDTWASLIAVASLGCSIGCAPCCAVGVLGIVGYIICEAGSLTF